jgi:hypothetical protein
VVQLAAPLPNATFREGVAVNIQALISNAGPDIDRVEFLVGEEIIASLDSPNAAGAASFSLSQPWQPPAAGQYTLSVIAFRADGSSSQPTVVTVTVVGTQPTATNTVTGSGSQTQPTQASGGQTQPTSQAAPTDPPPPTEPPPPAASPTPNKPTATFLQGVNVRSGPSTLFNPPIGSFATGQSTDILGRTPAADWYKVRYYNGEGWVFGSLITVSGDDTQIPVDAGPPPPTLTPIPPTPVPVTATPQTNVNLVAGLIRLNPAQPRCNETFQITVDIANFGTQASTGGSLSVVDVRVADGSQQGATSGAIGAIQPGQTLNSGNIPLTVSTHHSQDHRIVVVVDPNNVIAETNENDNRSEWTYSLVKGNCP